MKYVHTLYASNRDAPVGSSAEVKYNTIFINYCVWENVVQDAHYVCAREITKLVLAMQDPKHFLFLSKRNQCHQQA